MDYKELQQTARQVNEVLGLSPPIKVTIKADQLEKKLKETLELIEDSDWDQFNSTTIKILLWLDPIDLSKKKNLVFGYARVSTIEQDADKFKSQILTFAHDKKLGEVYKIVTEKVSGTTSWKNRALATVVENAHKDDILIVPELSRLGRSLVDILEVLEVLTKKKVKVFSIKEAFQINGDSMQEKVMRTMLSLFAEIERDLISQRTKEGLDAARKSGKKLGRPKGWSKSKLDQYKPEIIELIKMGVPYRTLSKKYDVHYVTMQNWLTKNDLKKFSPKKETTKTQK